MSKLVFILTLVVLLIIAVYLFVVSERAASYCKSYSETECKTKLVCRPTNEYGIHCGEDGCKEGERFKECSPRF